MLRAHEFFVVRRAIALGKNDSVKWPEVVAVIKVDKCGSHNALPRRGHPHPRESPKRYRLAAAGPTGAAGGKYD